MNAPQSPGPASTVRTKHPILWVPTSYFSMGTIYMTITFVTTIMYKNLGMADAQAAFWASALGFPYVVKFLWAPLLEMFGTKKVYVVTTQLGIAGIFVLIALALKMPAFVPITLGLLLVAAVLGATQDVGADGVYVTALNRKDQARFTGFQSLCWSIGPIFASGVLIRFSGQFHDGGMEWDSAWQLICFVIAGTIGVMALYHAKMMPPGEKAKDAPRSVAEAAATMGDAFKTLFQKKGIWMMLSFAFLYRFGQGLLDKIGPLFMINDRAAGGLGLNNQLLGDINGTYGMIGFLIGGVIGGFFVAKNGLSTKLLFFLCCMMNIPNATYIYLGMTQPDSAVLIGTVVTLEKFGFGFGAVGHMIYMMQQLAPGKYRTAHYAIGTALMGFCMMFTGMVSGYIAEALGSYTSYFIFVMVATIPSFIVTWLAPFHVTDEAAAADDEGEGSAAAA
jgi:PAT family beta-lactamase induction signal transducer AmpG